MSDSTPTVQTLRIEGMSCSHCVSSVQAALGALDRARVRSVEVGRAEVEVDPDGPSRDELVSAVEAVGFDVAN